MGLILGIDLCDSFSQISVYSPEKRAPEPLLLGGGTADQLPPQLGARAVALVWRDPATSTSGTENGYPHRTRLLFYKPLD